jgi:hypothetical protein
MARILADIEQAEHVFDFDRDGLGDQAAETTAAAIFEYMDAEVGPDNNPWLELSDRYKKWKDTHFPGRKIGELHLHMKDPQQLRGTLQISSNEMIQQYGVDEEARLLAEWFQEGHSGQNRPPRPFYDFNDLALAALGELFDHAFATIR